MVSVNTFVPLWFMASVFLLVDWPSVQGFHHLKSYIQIKETTLHKDGSVTYNDTCITHTPSAGHVPDKNKRGPFKPIVFKSGEEVVTDDCFRCKCFLRLMRCDPFGVNTWIDFVAPKGCHYEIRGCEDIPLVKTHNPTELCYQ